MDALVAASLFMIDVSLSALTVSESLVAVLLNDHPVQHYVSRNADLAFVAQLRISTLRQPLSATDMP